MSDFKTYEVMPVDVYEGGCGHIVILQEWSETVGERYLRVMLNERDAELLCQKIMAVAGKIRRK